jgi:predicted MFS family arabinose efflux permease
VTLVIFGLTEGPSRGWTSAGALVPLSAGAALLIAFAAWELRQRYPLLDVRIFRDRAFTAAILVGIIVAAGLFGVTFLMPAFMQQVQGYSTQTAGLLLGAQGLGAAIVMPISGTLTDRIGPRPVVLFGVVVTAVATILMAGVTPDTGQGEWLALLTLRGIGFGFAMMPAFTAAYATLSSSAIPRATAMSNTLQRVFSSFGVALLATVLESRIAVHLPFAPGGFASAATARPVPPAVVHHIHAAVAQAFDETLWISAGMTLLALPATVLLRRPARAGERPAPASRAERVATAVLVVVALGTLLISLQRALAS